MIRSLVSRALGSPRLPSVPLQGADDARWSVISSAHDLSPSPDEDLLDLVLRAAEAARTRRLASLEARCAVADRTWVQTWPGEHYRLLAALTRSLDARHLVEVGTFKGHGALALVADSPEARVVTYDIVAWDGFADTALRMSDFDSGQVEQRLGDLGDPVYRASQLETLRAAELIFIDGPKDGVWESRAIPDILSELTDRRRLVVLDDIRLVPMVQLWRDLPYSKLDLTSFGHWSGTGLLWTA